MSRPVHPFEAQWELRCLRNRIQRNLRHVERCIRVQGSRPSGPVGDQLLREMHRIARTYSLALSDVEDAMDAIAALDDTPTVEGRHAA